MDGEVESRKEERERGREKTRNLLQSPTTSHMSCLNYVRALGLQVPSVWKWGTFREGGGRHPRVLAGHLAHIGAQSSFSQNRYRSEGLWGCAGPLLATLPTWDDKW